MPTTTPSPASSPMVSNFRFNVSTTTSEISSRSDRLKSAAKTTLHHITRHTGVGIVCAVAFFDPGNWGVDLLAGSQFGYRLLFIVLLAGLFGVFLQVLASRLGCVTGLDLASHCRLLLHDRPNHTLLWRWLALYPLYALSEVAIIATDMAELLGSAIALCMIFPSLPVWVGVLITAADVIFILALGDPLRGRPVKFFEWLIAALVLAVFVCMIIIITKLEIVWADAFLGYVPSKYIFAQGGLYTSVGIIGATCMPHSLFLGSALATQDRISPPPPVDSNEPVRTPMQKVKEYFLQALKAPPPTYNTVAKSHAEWENSSIAFVRAHIYHGVFDVAGSLLGFAVLINSMILILASAVFYYGAWGQSKDSTRDPASLFDAHQLIRELVGPGAALLFAFALLAAGQSSSIIATVAGQAVSEGFLQWRVSPVIRRLLTRMIGLVPSMVVAVAVGRSGIDTLLVASQVVLAVTLPFISFPLLYLTSSKTVMRVSKPRASVETSPQSLELSPVSSPEKEEVNEAMGETEYEDFSSSKITVCVGGVIWLVVVTANVYVLVQLGMGTTT